jgi:hypothetical protein
VSGAHAPQSHLSYFRGGVTEVQTKLKKRTTGRKEGKEDQLEIINIIGGI